MSEHDQAKEDLAYWLSRPPQERVAAVDFLRKQVYGDWSPDFKELFELLNAHKVEYVVVGGYAMAFHGAPRVTGDIDLFVRPDRRNAQRIIDALKEFGFESADLAAEDFQQPDSVIQLGVPPVRIDFITSLSGVSWQQASSGKLASTYGSVPVFYVGKAELAANKKALGRKKDLADLEALEEE